MYYLVHMDHSSKATHFTRSECEGFLRSAVNPVQWMRLMMIMLRNDCEDDGSGDCEEDEGTDCENRDSDTVC